jgi:hypothetical protein
MLEDSADATADSVTDALMADLLRETTVGAASLASDLFVSLLAYIVLATVMYMKLHDSQTRPAAPAAKPIAAAAAAAVAAPAARSQDTMTAGLLESLVDDAVGAVARIRTTRAERQAAAASEGPAGGQSSPPHESADAPSDDAGAPGAAQGASAGGPVAAAGAAATAAAAAAPAGAEVAVATDLASVGAFAARLLSQAAEHGALTPRLFMEANAALPAATPPAQRVYNRLIYDALAEAVGAVPADTPIQAVIQRLVQWRSIGLEGGGVDAVVMDEMAACESEWTQTRAVEQDVKSRVADLIFDSLVADTASAVSSAVDARVRRRDAVRA